MLIFDVVDPDDDKALPCEECPFEWQQEHCESLNCPTRSIIQPQAKE